MADFAVGDKYSRANIQTRLGLRAQTGGDWATGYHQHDGEWFLFPNIGVAGRTGHDYDNRWVPEGLHWYGKTGSHLGQPTIQSMLKASARVHLFTREADRDPFEYRGLVVPVRTIDATPVEIIWRPRDPASVSSHPLA